MCVYDIIKKILKIHHQTNNNNYNHHARWSIKKLNQITNCEGE